MALALHPLVYLPFHMAGHHMTARCFSHKKVTYPLHFIFSLVQYMVEHFSAEFPTIAALNGALVAITISMAPVFYYCAYHKTTGPKSLVWLGVAMFFVILPTFKGLELGFPKDDPAEQAQANLEAAHSYWHLLLHVALASMQLVVTYHVPWSPKAETVEVPVSPAHSTLSRIARERSEMGCGAPDSPCSPRKQKATGMGGAKARWPCLPHSKVA